ncbi:MAG: hypothetical protein WCI73_07450 [Phycisphaerae bacterium]
MGLLLLCVGGWVWSSSHQGDVAYYHGRSWVGCQVAWGAAYFTCGMLHSPTESGFSLHYEPLTETHFFWPYPVGGYLGWEDVDDAPPGTPHYLQVSLHVPLWFFTLIVLVFDFFVWRKTRPKNGKLRAFPVEVKVSGRT